MAKPKEEKSKHISIVNRIMKLRKFVKIPGLQGLSLYDIIEMYVIGIAKGALTARAGGIAFSFFMALFPFLLFILTLIPYVPIEGFQADFLRTIHKLLPPNTWSSVNEVILDIANNRYGGLLSFGFIASIFLMTNGVNAVLGGFEYSYHIGKDDMRNVIKQYFISMGMAILLSLILLFTIAVNVYFVFLVNDLKVHGWLNDDVFWIQFGRDIFLLALLFVSVSFLYKFGVKESKNSIYIPGAILTTFLTIVMFKLFSIYVLKFATYNELYGSIGTLLIIMLFVWLNSIILLLGFELNATINSLRRLHLKE